MVKRSLVRSSLANVTDQYEHVSGLIDTPMTQTAEFRDNVPVPMEVIPLGRPAGPEEVGKLIAFLLSDDAGYVSGSVYTVDAGMSC